MSSASAKPVTYPQLLLLGDSITERSSLTLQAYLSDTYARRLDVINRGLGGCNAVQGLKLLNHLYPASCDFSSMPQVKLALVAFGANDATLPQAKVGCTSRVDFQLALRDMVRHPAFAAMGTKVVLVTPPPINEHQLFREEWGASWSAARTREYRDIVLEVGKEEGVPVVDIWLLFMRLAGGDPDAPPNGLNGNMEAPQSPVLQKLLEEGLHLTDKGYRVVYDEVMRVLAEEAHEVLPGSLPLAVSMPMDEDGELQFIN